MKHLGADSSPSSCVLKSNLLEYGGEEVVFIEIKPEAAIRRIFAISMSLGYMV